MLLKFTSFKLAIPFFIAVAVSACQLHSVDKNVAPSLEVQPDAYLAASLGDAQAQSKDPWWESFQRPTLNKLITQAFENNFDIKQLSLRARQAEALIDGNKADYFPQLSISASQSVQQADGGEQAETSASSLGLDWELDAFNPIGYAAQFQRLQTLGLYEDLAALRLVTSGQIAQTYFAAVAARQTLDLLEQKVKTDQRLLNLIELRLSQGVGTQVEVLQQKARVSESSSLIPLAEARLRLEENRLSVLLGQAPKASSWVSPSETLLFNQALPPLKVPIDLLQNRPDLRAAKARLVQADAAIGEAIANRLPRLNITAAYSQSSDFLLSPIASASASLFLPLLDWGKRKAQVTRNELLYQERLADFTELYIEAIAEVENASYQESRQREFIKRLELRQEILQKTVDVTEDRFKEGVDDYLPVLSALQELRVIERSLIEQALVLINSRIALHQALGGNIHFKKEEQHEPS